MAKFSSFDAWQKSLESRLMKAVKPSLVELGDFVMDETPEDTTRLVSNYKTSLNTPDYSSNYNLMDGGSSAYNDLTTTVNNMEIEDSLYFTNSIDYAINAEEDGWLFTPAYGMVRMGIDNWQNIFSKNFNKHFK